MNHTAINHTIDLHSHTRYSDGTLTLPELLEQAKQQGVTHLAVTDHDAISAHFEDATSIEGINVIPGTEISCQYGNREIHIVGLFIDPNEPKLKAFIKRQQHQRKERMQQYVEKLVKCGLPDFSESIAEVKADSLTRTHLSQIMVQSGAVASIDKVFKRYIGRKGSAYVAMAWPALEEVVSVIKEAGGVAVIAHPQRYQLSRKQLQMLIDDFVDAGGEAVEMAYPNINVQVNQWLTKVLLQRKLYASQGSDYHGPEWKWVRPGYFAPMPKELCPVWQHPRAKSYFG